MATTDGERLREALSAADFPAEKTELVAVARAAGADEDTVRALSAMPPVSYANLAEVIQSVEFAPDRTEAERAEQRRRHTKPGVSETVRDVPEPPITEELGENRGS